MDTPAGALAARLIRNFNDAPTARDVREPLYDSLGARLAKGTAAQKLGVSVDVVAPGKRSCPYHFHHAQEEMFIVVDGDGTLRVAGEMLPIRAGDVIFIPPGPDYPHQIINTSGKPLKYLSVSTRESPEIVEYPDSAKFLASAAVDGVLRFDALQRKAPNVDYWDGEP
ncbi:MAG: cupin domain-containing protein [Betaproteobacteria bacterium]